MIPTNLQMSVPTSCHASVSFSSVTFQDVLKMSLASMGSWATNRLAVRSQDTSSHGNRLYALKHLVGGNV